MGGIGRVFIFLGILLFIFFGLIFTFWEKTPFLGQMPGDISFGNEKFRVYLPIVTSIVLSLVLTIALNLVLWLFNR
jgi:hypothetical protein